MNKDLMPPGWMQTLLRQFADEDTVEETEGDLLEFYRQWETHLGRNRASWKYFYTVVTLLRPWKKKRKEFNNANTLIMIRSYLIMSWRTILKNKISSIINLSGLTLGLTTSLLILLIILKEVRYDQQHLKRDSIFMMLKHQKTSDGISTGRSTPGPMAEALRTDYPQVVHAARVAFFDDVLVHVNQSKLTASGIYAEPDIFRMMTYKPIKGEPAAALEANSVVLSKNLATTFFGDQDPIGQLLEIGGGYTLFVGAIIEEIPSTNTLKFQMAIPFKAFEKNSPWLTKWDDNRINTWVELNNPGNLAEFNAKVSSMITQRTQDQNESTFAYPLTRLHLYGNFSNGQPSGGFITIIWILVGFGVFMLLIACVNFMNIATAQSARRAKEVGVRKVMGAARRWIIFQFLNESLVITILSLVVAVGLCILLIPSFNLMMHTSISFEYNNGVVWMSALIVAFITALVAGSYPAFVLSRFSPARVLKGIVNRPGGSSLRRVLVTFQFVISISVLIGTIILYAQFDHVKTRPIGYDQENLVNVRLDSLASAKFEVVKNEVLKIPGVKSVTGMSGSILNSSASITGMDWPDKKPDGDFSVSMGEANYDWIQTMGLEIVNGRDFSQQFKSDENACLLNEIAVDRMGLANPIGSVVGGHTVIGVVGNFVYNNPSGVIAPMMITLTPDNVHRLYARIDNNDSWSETLASIEKTVKKISPEIEFDLRFTTDEYQHRFEELSNIGLMVSIFGGMTIFISCLGLFGLSGFVAERRGKEMSIRKVFGASNIRVLLSLSSDILKPVVLALLIVVPLSIWVAGMLLNEIVYHVQLQWWMFVQAGGIVVAVAFFVVLYHGLRTASESPAVRLKSE